MAAMLLAHRAPWVAVGVLAAGLALTGCRSEPTVAAYVDQKKITEANVDSMINDAADAKDEAIKKAKKDNKPGDVDAAQALKVPVRSDVVTTLVLSPVCDQAQAKLGFQKQEISVDQ